MNFAQRVLVCTCTPHKRDYLSSNAPPAAPAAIIPAKTSGDGEPAMRRPTAAPVIAPA